MAARKHFPRLSARVNPLLPVVRLLALLLTVTLAAGAHAEKLDADSLLSADSHSDSASATDMAATDRLMHAFDLLGTRYQRRGVRPETGFDCSGFIGWVFRTANGISLPRTAHEMFSLQPDAAAKVARDALAPGDLVFFRIGRNGKRIDHVGLYAGEGRFIHSPASGGEVRLDAIDLPYWMKRYVGARRVLAQGAVALLPEVVGGDQDSLSLAGDNVADTSDPAVGMGDVPMTATFTTSLTTDATTGEPIP